MGSHKDGAMSLGARHAGNPMRTVMTMAAKLKTVGDFAAFLSVNLLQKALCFPAGQSALRSEILISKASIRYSFSNPGLAALGWAGPISCHPASLASWIASAET